jgi:plastocyanin
MPTRHIYLRIETIPGYSPVSPDPMPAPPAKYGRDCMRNMGHEDSTIPQVEINARTLSAVVYREYLDSAYLVPKPDKLVVADINEPPYHRRVPGTVIYSRPDETLKIHVLNAHTEPHSFHLHGLLYGIDSDGSWPLGTHSRDGRRSDEICPGQDWTYTFHVTDKMIGAWPFHDHCHDIGANINRGLFGGIVILPHDLCETLPPPTRLPKEAEDLLRRIEKDPDAARGLSPLDFEEYLHLPNVHPVPKPESVLHVPLFFHFMSGSGGIAAFDSGPIPLGGTFQSTFGSPGTFNYHCQIHSFMHGTVTVAPGEADEKSVNIDDSDPLNMKFNPAVVAVRPGGIVRWHNANNNVHTVTEDASGTPSYCFNGRSFVGNTPTIVASAGQKICWYVFNLDLGMNWHNYHPHGQRWHFANEAIDVRSLGPAESFIVETEAPPVLLLPPGFEHCHHPHEGAKAYHLRGDFLVHCHVEMHMMSGLAGLVRSRQSIWLTHAQADQLAHQTGLPLDTGGNDCPPIDPDRCRNLDCGKWEEVVGNPEVCMMHAALLPNTNKVLFWGYGDARDDISRLWDYSTPAGSYASPANQPFNVTAPVSNRPLANLWSAEHAFLDSPAGTLLVHGGFTDRESYLFDPAALLWSRTGQTAQPRFYSTSLTLADGKVLTLIGGTASRVRSTSIEVYDPASGTWAAPIPLPPPYDFIYYPWTYLLPGGDLFIAGTGDAGGTVGGVSLRFRWPSPNPPAASFPTVFGNRSTGAEKGTSVLLPLRPPDYKPRVLIAGGDLLSAQQTFEMIDLSSASPAWTQPKGPDGVTPLMLNVPRTVQVNSVLLPDGRVFLAGGILGTGGPSEIFDPENPSAGWMRCAAMKYSRGYHSAAILLVDGSVLMGGDQNNIWKSGESTQHERYYPWYYFRARPVLTTAPSPIHYGGTFTINSPNASSITGVVLLRPGAVTHGFNMSQRFVGCEILGGGATTIQVKAPADANIAPPGWYLLFIVDAGRVPSVAKWIRLTP